MSIEDMIKVSDFLMAASGIFAAAAVVLFFALDILKCWRMVRGRGNRYKSQPGVNKAYKVKWTKTEKNGKSKSRGESESTRLLEDGTAEKTVLLCDRAAAEQTIVLETEYLEIIQDIAYMQEKG